MLDKLRMADFIPYLNQEFRVSYDAADVLVAVLVEVEKLGRDADYPLGQSPTEGVPIEGQVRRPFSLVFLGPESDTYLSQRIYTLEHDQMGVFDLFLVPIGPDGRRMRYQAVFN